MVAATPPMTHKAARFHPLGEKSEFRPEAGLPGPTSGDVHDADGGGQGRVLFQGHSLEVEQRQGLGRLRGRLGRGRTGLIQNLLHARPCRRQGHRRLVGRRHHRRRGGGPGGNGGVAGPAGSGRGRIGAGLFLPGRAQGGTRSWGPTGARSRGLGAAPPAGEAPGRSAPTKARPPERPGSAASAPGPGPAPARDRRGRAPAPAGPRGCPRDACVSLLASIRSPFEPYGMEGSIGRDRRMACGESIGRTGRGECPSSFHWDRTRSRADIRTGRNGVG